MGWTCNSGGASLNIENILSEYLEGMKYWRDICLYVL
jgi:hypothetical protein